MWDYLAECGLLHISAIQALVVVNLSRVPGSARTQYSSSRPESNTALRRGPPCPLLVFEGYLSNTNAQECTCLHSLHEQGHRVLGVTGGGRTHLRSATAKNLFGMNIPFTQREMPFKPVLFLGQCAPHMGKTDRPFLTGANQAVRQSLGGRALGTSRWVNIRRYSCRVLLHSV